jgi:hypothetical protein
LRIAAAELRFGAERHKNSNSVRIFGLFRLPINMSRIDIACARSSCAAGESDRARSKRTAKALELISALFLSRSAKSQKERDAPDGYSSALWKI